MRIEVFGNGFEVTDVVRTYAESRVWLAVQRASRELSWVGVRLMSEDDEVVDKRIVCQLDVWLRGIGLVTVRHAEFNPYIAIDCAAVRLEQAVVRKLRDVGRYAVTAASNRPALRRRRHRSGHEISRRYAVVMVPSDERPRLSLVPWLRTCYGVEQAQTISLDWREWDALVAGDLDSSHLTRLGDRLALAQLSRPDVIVVVGGAVPHPSYDERPQARVEVEQVVENVRSLGLPIEVIGVWVNEHWSSDDCLIESEELPLRTGRPSGSEREEELYAGLTSD
jgi:ribosome-associated translation inhibitor RaiA